MAIFSVEIADEDVERVITAVANNYNYQEEIIDADNRLIENPESKYVFANRMVRKFLSDHVKRYELELAKKSLEQQLEDITINDPQV